MRNEGEFLLEWLAYHLEIGFDRAVICTNDCTDGSDTLLDILADRGLVTHLPHSPAPDQAPQDSGMAVALKTLEGSNTDWILFIDADEFLNIGLGQGRLPDLLTQAGSADVIALAWRFFGNNGLTDWQGGSVLEQFTMAEDTPNPDHINFKSMFRRASFAHAHDHMPQQPRIPAPRVVNAMGDALPNRPLLSKRKYRKYQPLDRATRWEAAQLNHYAVKSDDQFLMKNHRGDGQNGMNTGKRYHLNWKWHRAANRNDHSENSILRHLPAVQSRLIEWRSDPAIAKAETACIDWHIAQKQRILTPEQRAKWTFERQSA